MATQANGKKIGQWIRPAKRLAIYLRDGCACVWCGAGIEDTTGNQILTLDHIVVHSKTQDNTETNLVTACYRCNATRGRRSIYAFATAVAAYRGNITAEEILRTIRNTSRKSLAPYKIEAKRLIERRGSAFAALNQKG
jgi:5-methylcytosine-specific restriction endonuclease McrA